MKNIFCNGYHVQPMGLMRTARVGSVAVCGYSNTITDLLIASLIDWWGLPRHKFCRYCYVCPSTDLLICRLMLPTMTQAQGRNARKQLESKETGPGVEFRRDHVRECISIFVFLFSPTFFLSSFFCHAILYESISKVTRGARECEALWSTQTPSQA